MTDTLDFNSPLNDGLAQSTKNAASTFNSKMQTLKEEEPYQYTVLTFVRQKKVQVSPSVFQIFSYLLCLMKIK